MIRPWIRHAALEPDELQALQATFDSLKEDLAISGEAALQVLAADLMNAYERFHPDCDEAAEAVRAIYLTRD